jgi:hypothetical protein
MMNTYKKREKWIVVLKVYGTEYNIRWDRRGNWDHTKPPGDRGETDSGDERKTSSCCTSAWFRTPVRQTDAAELIAIDVFQAAQVSGQPVTWSSSSASSPKALSTQQPRFFGPV